MSFSKDRAHRLIDELSEEEIASIWTVLSELHSDLYLLRAIQVSKEMMKPGDSFSREEAIQFLMPL